MRDNKDNFAIYKKHTVCWSLPANIPIMIFAFGLALGFLGITGCQSRGSGVAPATKEIVSASCPPGRHTAAGETVAGTIPAEASQTFGASADTTAAEASKVLESGSVPSMSSTQRNKKAKLTTITVNAAGDCTFGSDYKSPASVNFYAVYNKKKNPAYFFKNVKKFFAEDDLTLVNLEGTLTGRTTRMDKTYAFRGSPSYVKILKKASIEAVSFANNHCQDFGPGSYTDTIATLKKAGVKYASYGKVSVFKAKGLKIGMVSVNALLGYSSSQQYIHSGIRKLKKRKANLIIVSMHAGVEHTSSLNNVQTGLAHYAVQQGANLVLGHHPHVLQGIEKYRGAYIVYSLGNFCFGGNTNPSDKDTMIFQQSFTFQGKRLLKKKSQAKVIPCRISSTASINDYQPTPLRGKGKRRVISRLNSYSRPFGVIVKNTGVLGNK